MAVTNNIYADNYWKGKKKSNKKLDLSSSLLSVRRFVGKQKGRKKE